MGHDNTNGGRAARATLGAIAIALWLCAFVPSAQAGPFHPRLKSLDVTGLNHACGAAVDSKGDLYLSSAGTSEVKVYDPSHAFLTSIPDSNQPCGLAVTTTGDLYVSERATGEVVRFKPNAYPFVGTPTYGSREVIDASGKAKGIAVDRFDNFLYVAEGTKVAIYKSDGSFEANVGEGTLTEATGVAPYTYANGQGNDRYLWAADANGLAADRLYLFRPGLDSVPLKLRRTLDGTTTPDGSFGFGAAGAYLAADPGNRGSEGKCPEASAQACTAGHVFLYDAAHKALDEFDATGEFLDQTHNAGFEDAGPTAIAIDRSGTAGDGTLYVTAEPGGGAKALAFGPLKAPTRATLAKPISKQPLATANAVATDSNGYVYVATGTQVHIYKPDGTEILTGGKAPIEDTQRPWDLAVDSTGKVYVLDKEAEGKEEDVTYYTPSAYPPVTGVTYSRHESVVAASKDFPVGSKTLKAIAVDPGPGTGKDGLFVTAGAVTRRYKTAAEGSEQLDANFAPGVGSPRQSLAVDGARDVLYVGINPSLIYKVDEATGETLARIQSTCPPSGAILFNPLVAVDQSNGHLLEYDKSATAREYDASGACVAEFGAFTKNLGITYRVAVDSACALHEPPLTGEACKAFDPADGNVYVAYDDTKAGSFDVTAFGPLDYGTAAKHKLTIEKTGSGSGKVSSEPAGIDCGSTCSAEYEETEVVTLTATPDEGSKLVKWEGCEAEPSVSECEVTMSEDRKVVAEFESTATEHFPLEVILEGPGSGEVSSSPTGIECPGTCSAEFGKGVEVTLTAKADKGSELVGWSGCEAETLSGSGGTCTVTMTELKEVEVELGVEHPLLTVVKEGAGAGTVTSEGPGIDCGLTCSAPFELGEEVTLKAEASEGSELTGWGAGDCEAETVSATEGTCTVTMSEAKEVSTTFLALPQAFAKPAHPIAYTEATLRGEVDTVELPTEYRFEYLSEEEYESNGETFAGAKETPLGELEPAEAPTAVEAPLLGLKEATRYRFRLWAMNSAGQAEDEGAFETLQRRGPESCPNATYRFGPSANLPDCRAYELVTPADTNGGDISAPLPGSPDEGFNNLLTVPRGANAGEALSFASSTTLPGFDGSGDADGYLAERGAGSHPEAGWSTELQSPSYVQGGGSPTGANPLNGSPDQLYSFWAIRSSHGLEGGFPEGTYLRSPAGFEAVGRGSLDTDLEATPEYASPGGAHILFSSNAHLEGGAAPAGTEAIYDREAGKASAEVISVKSGGGSFGAGEGASYLGASEDGTAVVFRVGGALYLHHEGQTVEVVGQNATYAGISEAGDRVFYAAEGALWVFEAGTQTKIAEGGEATFVNVSADGSHAFFTSTAALTLAGEENENLEHAEGGKHNLYAWDDSGTHFVALLDTQDLAGFAGEPATNLGAWVDAITAHSTIGAANSPARSNPTGEVFVFQSHARLTAYDNEGIGEIYRYDPAATAGARLRCVSCDPSGASPGDEAVLRSEALPDIVLSGVDWRTVIPNLTDDGEAVFFQSPDRLLPEDANEVEDVYEWRAKGSGTPECTRSAGCLALISSGQGETASSLFSMSADGHDVFVRTREKLVGSDILGSPSIYDAREGGGIPEAIEPAPCQGDACQGQGSEPPTLSTPATKGAGEEANPRPWPCGKGRHRVRGRCVKRHVSKHHRHRHRRPHR